MIELNIPYEESLCHEERKSVAYRRSVKADWRSHQIPVVDAIQLCVALDIPLKHLTDYCMDGGSRIHYGKLIERGTSLAE